MISAWYWLQSSRISVEIKGIPPIVTGRGAVITTYELEEYLKKVGPLNAKAAGTSALAVLLSAVASVLGSWPH
jgi:hypothetical protein